MIRAHRILIVCAIAALLPSPPAVLEGAEIPPDWKIDNSRGSSSIQGAEIIEVQNLHGDLRIRPLDEEEVEWSAMIQRHAEDPRLAEIRTSREGPIFYVEVVYTGPDPPDSSGIDQEWAKRRVDLALFVPAKRRLTIETTHGLIEVKGLDQGVSARSQSGDIAVASAGTVTATTERGSISVHFSATAWESPVQLETLTGDISVTLPPDSDTTVTMATNGQITTDFTLSVEHAPGSEYKTAEALIGKGASKLSMTSNRGNLKLLRAPF